MEGDQDHNHNRWPPAGAGIANVFLSESRGPSSDCSGKRAGPRGLRSQLLATRTQRPQFRLTCYNVDPILGQILGKKTLTALATLGPLGVVLPPAMTDSRTRALRT